MTGHRLDALLDRLATDLRQAPLSPFADEVIVVQSLGMERWMRLELARRQGCAASLRLPFPAAFCHDLARALGGGHEDAGPDERFAGDVLTWRIRALLDGGITTESVFVPLRTFVADGDARQRMGLAATIAARFDDYQLFRPDVLVAWERGEPGDTADDPHARWQAELWRRLCGGDAPHHLARRFLGVIDELESATEPPSGLPSRVAVFGVSSLPPLFVRLLGAVARFAPVTVYAAAPARATWADGSANPLFAGSGRQLREFLSQLDERSTAWEELDADAAPHESAGASCLHVIQRDVWEGIARPSAADTPVPMGTNDSSLLVHGCHSPMREMEVVRDQLLAAFAADASLRPHDVLVLVPDADAYAPYIEAVFGVAEDGVPRIPYSIADRSAVHQHSLVGALLQLVGLVGGRKTAPEVMALLDVAAVRRAAGLDGADIATLLGWVRDTRVCWGRDADERADVFALPRVDAHSWRAGIDRLLMGYAAGDVDDVIAGVLPHAGHTVGDPRLLGRFAAWLDHLFVTIDGWRAPRPLERWAVSLADALDLLFEADDEGEERSLALLRTQLARLGRVQELAQCDAAVDLALVRDWLGQTLADHSPGLGFLTGGMTFCAFKPMRSIPFRVVAVAGLDDATFPRRGRRAPFELQALAPRAGDRDVRTDDRQIFLDVLLAARDQLILTYVARSARDNKERAPSVVLAELLDVAESSLTTATADPTTGRPASARTRLVVEHRLQPFSPAYFTSESGGRLFSYSRGNARAGATTLATRVAPPAFVASPIDAGAVAEMANAGVVALDDLIACWTNPSRFFCRRVLGLRLDDAHGVGDESEALSVDHLASYAVLDRMLRGHMAGTRDRARELAHVAARGELPPAALGRAWHDKLDGDVAQLLERVGRPEFVEPRPISVVVDGGTVVGRADALTTGGRLQARPAKVKAKDLVRAWITHLALNAQDPGAASTTRVVGIDATVVYQPVDNTAEQLAALVHGYRAAWCTPMPVFEQASRAYVDQVVKLRSGGKASKDPIALAREKFRGPGPDSDYGAPGDVADPYVKLAFRGRDPFADGIVEQFTEMSERLWAGAVESQQQEKA